MWLWIPHPHGDEYADVVPKEAIADGRVKPGQRVQFCRGRKRLKSAGRRVNHEDCPDDVTVLTRS